MLSSVENTEDQHFCRDEKIPISADIQPFAPYCNCNRTSCE